MAGLLITIINPTLLRNRSKDGVIIGNVSKIAQAVEAFNAGEGSYPILNSFVEIQSAATPYMKSLPTDAVYTYAYNATNKIACVSAPSTVTVGKYFKYVSSCVSGVTGTPCTPGKVQVNCATPCLNGLSASFTC